LFRLILWIALHSKRLLKEPEEIYLGSSKDQPLSFRTNLPHMMLTFMEDEFIIANLYSIVAGFNKLVSNQSLASGLTKRSLPLVHCDRLMVWPQSVISTKRELLATSAVGVSNQPYRASVSYHLLCITKAYSL